MRRARFALAGLAAVTEAVVAVLLVAGNDDNEHPWLVASFAVGALLSFVVAGLVALWRRPDNRIGSLLAGTGYLWFLGALGESSNEWLWITGYVVGDLSFVAFVALILAYPEGKLMTRDRWLIATGAVVVLGTNLVTVLVEEAPATNCAGCPNSPIAVADLPRVGNTITIVATVIVVALLVVVAAILVERWRRASPALRHALRPVFLSAGASLALLTLAVVVDRFDSRAYTALWVVFLVSFAAVPLSFLGLVLHGKLSRSLVADLLVSLDSGSELRDAIAKAVGDPSLDVAYWLDDQQTWVDARGRRLDEPMTSEARSVTMVEQDARYRVALIHDPALDAEPEVVRSVAAAARLSLRNEALQAQTRSQYEFLVTLVDTAPSLFVHIDADGVIRNQNAAAVAATGLADEGQIRGRPFWEVFIDPEQRTEAIERFRAAAPGHAEPEYESSFTNVNGRGRPAPSEPFIPSRCC